MRVMREERVLASWSWGAGIGELLWAFVSRAISFCELSLDGKLG